MLYLIWFYRDFDIDFRTILMAEYRNKPGDGPVWMLPNIGELVPGLMIAFKRSNSSARSDEGWEGSVQVQSWTFYALGSSLVQLNVIIYYSECLHILSTMLVTTVFKWKITIYNTHVTPSFLLYSLTCFTAFSETVRVNTCLKR